MKVSNPRFSIVIPTRNRHNTLKFALLTCINQKNFDDYEIIVCDNCSSPETGEIVKRFESEKIKYIRSDRPLAMSHNWELAVSHAEGEYVIVIGDDDGLLLNALTRIEGFLKTLGVKALRWEHIFYKWPDFAIDPNLLSIPLTRENRILQGRDVISKVANYRMDWKIMPEMYNSAIHRDLINLLREKTGRVFASSSPDVYSGFAFAYLSQRYASIGIPMSIGGTSAASNGFAVFRSKDNAIAQEFNSLNAKGFSCHPQIPDVPVLPAVIADSFQRAKDALFPNDGSLRIDRKKLIINCMRSLNIRYHENLDDEAKFRMYMEKNRDSLADNIKLQKWFDDRFKIPSIDHGNFEPRYYPLLRKVDKRLFGHKSQNSDAKEFNKRFNGKDLVLDASKFNLENVFAVAKFCENFYDPEITSLDWHGQGFRQELLIQIKNLRLDIIKILRKYNRF
jgi:glycosyltransferase involved in cell wall biosynthesis